MSKPKDQNQPLYDLAAQLGSINVSLLGSGICVAKGAKTYSIIFDTNQWGVDNADEIEVDYRTFKSTKIGFVVQGGSAALSAVISEAKRVFRPKGDANWTVKNPPVVLTAAEFAAKA